MAVSQHAGHLEDPSSETIPQCQLKVSCPNQAVTGKTLVIDQDGKQKITKPKNKIE